MVKIYDPESEPRGKQIIPIHIPITMNIVFDNYNQNQIVTEQVIVLKGSIALKGQLLKLNPDSFQASLCTCPASEPCATDTHIHIPFKLIQNKFVLVAHLNSGQNKLVFTYDQMEIGKISIELQEPGPIPKYYVQSLIVYCSESIYEEHYINNLKSKIELGIRLAQAIFSELLFMQEVRSSFQIRNPNQCNVIKLGLAQQDLANNYTTQKLWEHLAREIKGTPSLWSSKCKYVAFVLDPWKSGSSDMQGLGGGGLALLDVTCLEFWPAHWSQVLDCIWDQKTSTTEHNTKGTIGQDYSKSLGGLVHEMGHVFDLGHVDIGIMAAQYHHCNLIFAPIHDYKDQTVSFILPNNGQITANTFSLTKSSSTILHYHRWFRSCPETNDLEKGITLESRNTIKSAWPLSAIELRDTATGLVLVAWVFDEKDSPKYAFSIGKRSIPPAYRSNQVQLVAQNKCGTIFNEIIDCCKLPEVFTDIKRRDY